MKKELLIMSCRSSFLDNDRVYPPLAGLYLKSYIEKHSSDVNVTVMDEYDLEHPEIFEKFSHIGISIMTPQRAEATKILNVIKTYYPQKIVIAGGPHVKYYLEDIKSEPYDYLVPLDGEKAILEILNGTATRIVKSVMSKDDILNAPRPDRTSDNAKKILSNYSYNLGGKKATTMMMARGCPNECTFCEEARSMVRWSSLDNIVKELDDIKALGYEGVYIFDDLFAMSIKIMRPIVYAMKERNLIYRCNGHARYLTREMAQLLSETGCYEIMFGAESGSQKILDTVKKHTTIQQNYDFVALCKEFGIVCKAFLMIGLPGETRETVSETEEFIAKSKVDDFQLAIYFPYKGTQIKTDIDAGKDIGLYITSEGLGAYGQKGGSTESTVRTAELSSQDLLELRDALVRKYKPESHKEMNK